MAHRPQCQLNANLLFVEPTRTDLEGEINIFFETNCNSGVSLSVMWDTLKAVLRGKIIALMASYKKEKTKLCEQLLQNIKCLEAIHKQTCNPKVYRKLQVEHKKLDALEMTKIQHHILYLN